MPPAVRTTHQCARRLTISSRLLALAIAIGQWVNSTQVNWPAGPVGRVTLGAVAAAILIFHVINTRTRLKLGHWKCGRLRRFLAFEVALGWAMPLAVLSMVLMLPPTWFVLLLIGLAFLITEVLYELVEEEIRRIVDEEGFQQGTSRFGRRQPFKIVGSNRTIQEISSTIERPGPQKFLGFWVKPSWWPGLSRTRTVIVYAMLLSAFVGVTAAADVGLQKAVVRPHSAHPIRVNHGNTEPRPPASGNGGGSAEASPVPANVPRPCPHQPSFEAPAWARDDLDALYYGTERLKATPPPGDEVGGCTGRAIVPTAQHGMFVYTLGRNAFGELRSVAVDSLEFGPAIFLAPAAQRVLTLLERGVAPLGGYPILQVAGGDAVAVTSERGTFALVRGSKHLPGSELATPYAELPPTAATAWVGAMKELGAWLWPQPPRVEGGMRQYSLVIDRTADDAVKIVVYDPSDGSARRDEYSYRLPESQIGEYELRHLARTAR